MSMEMMLKWLKWVLVFLYEFFWDVPQPHDCPKRLVAALDKSLQSLGGKTGETPNYAINHKKIVGNVSFWTLPIVFQPGRKIDSLDTYESTLEAVASRAGFDYNLRIYTDRFPRIEIDRPKVEIIPLVAVSETLDTTEINKMHYALGVTFEKNGMKVLTKQLIETDSAVLISGLPGQGKTQLQLTIITTLSWLNSPDKMTLHYCDGKVIDSLPLRHLVHLKGKGILGSPEKVLECTNELVRLMQERQDIIENTGDYSVLEHHHVLIIDELAEIWGAFDTKSEREQFTNNIVSLTQRGRGLSFAVILGTQRIYNLTDARIYSTINQRFCFRQRNGSDSTSASGIPGTALQKLRVGNFEIFPDEKSVQGFFVASPKQDNYKEELSEFVDQINERWASYPKASAPVQGDSVKQTLRDSVDETPSQPSGPSGPSEPKINIGGVEFSAKFVAALQEIDVNSTSLNAISRLHSIIVGHEIHKDKCKLIKQHFSSTGVPVQNQVLA